MTLKVLYRGSLSSCNYSCHYCPFAKSKASKIQLQQDEKELQRFVDWVKEQRGEMRLLFTPWGEALIWPYYQYFLTELSSMPHVRSVAIQTNLSCRLSWLKESKVDRLTLWASFHPSETTVDAFLSQCDLVLNAGAKLSVGVVGLKSNFTAIAELHSKLPETAFFWINAYKDSVDYYSTEEIEYLQSMDRLFKSNLRNYPSQDKACFSGESVFTVDGKGDMRRCHFIDKVISNVYTQDYKQSLKARNCTNTECSCYLGYIHLKALDSSNQFGSGYFERYQIV